jgi:hypothetical protein
MGHTVVCCLLLTRSSARDELDHDVTVQEETARRRDNGYTAQETFYDSRLKGKGFSSWDEENGMI